MDTVSNRTKGLTTTTKKAQRSCQKCWKKGEAIYYVDPHGKLLCGECRGIAPDDAIVRFAPADE